jgi:hypothetical protein
MSRYDKIAYCAENATFQRFVRICFEHPENGYNCGHCHHCYRMMAFVRSMGLADRFSTFPPLPNLDVLREMEVASAARRLHFGEMLAALDRFGREPAIAAAFRERLDLYVDKARHDRLPPYVRNLSEQAAAIRRQVQVLHASRSWQLTAPVRAIERLYRRVREDGK